MTDARPCSLTPAVARILTPKARLSVSSWATKKPFLIAEKGAVRPGAYDLAWTPWWREPLDAAGDPTVTHMSVVASSQTGKTKVGEIILCWHAEHRPANAIYIRPSEPDVAEAFRDRFEPMFRRNLPELVPAVGDWLTITDNPAIRLTTMNIYGAAATIDRHLTSRTALFQWYDETDTGGDRNNGLGNVLDQLRERGMAGAALYSFRMGTSTPKWPDGSNWRAYEDASDRREYWEPCPHCGAYQPLDFKSLRVAGGADHDPDTIRTSNLARYVCRKCGVEIEPAWQGWMSDRGVWVPACQRITEDLPLADDLIREHRSLTILPADERWEPARDGDMTPRPHRGYRVWRANTKFELCNWSNILATWFEVIKTKDPSRVQVFVNNWLAEPFSIAAEAADEEAIRRHIGVYDARTVPASAKLVLGAIDLQADCIWYGFRAFGPDLEQWLIQYGTVEVIADNYAAALDRVYRMAFVEGWPFLGGDGLRMRAYALAVDSGYRTDEAYEFSRRPGVIATKGEDTAAYRVRVTEVEGKRSAVKVRLYHLNTLTFKNRLQRFIKSATDEAGGWHLHRETTAEYVAHLTAECLKPKRSNKRILTWQPVVEGRANHMLDVEAQILGLAEALEQRQEISINTLVSTDPPAGVFRREAGQAKPAAVKPPAKRPAARTRQNAASGFLPDGDFRLPD